MEFGFKTTEKYTIASVWFLESKRNLILYNIFFISIDQLKGIWSLKLQPQLINFFLFALQTAVALLLFEEQKIGWRYKTKNKKKIQRI